MPVRQCGPVLPSRPCKCLMRYTAELSRRLTNSFGQLSHGQAMSSCQFLHWRTRVLLGHLTYSKDRGD